jgi:general secretion pathway protein F
VPEFRYTAITAAGGLTHGVMEAASEARVIDALRRQGHTPMRAEPLTKRAFLAGLLQTEFGRGQTIRRQEMTNLTRELSIMLGAGQDLDRALRFLVDTAPNARVRAVTEDLRNGVRDGRSLAAALTRHPRSFPKLYVGLVRAGETGGMLAETLDKLAELLERQRALAATITSAMIYPGLLMVAAIGSITLLLTRVLPQFVPMFEQNGVALPAATQLLISAGDAVSSYGLYALLAMLLVALAVRQALQQPGLRLRFDRLLLRLPVTGALAREVLAARFSRTLGTLMQNGVPLIGALAIVRDTLGNTAGVAAVDEATVSAKAGAGLARPLGACGLFPERTIYLLRLGEETAQLGPLALRAAAIHEEQTRLGVQRLVALLVPVITIVMGAAIAGIISALLLAMLSLNDLAG